MHPQALVAEIATCLLAGTHLRVSTIRGWTARHCGWRSGAGRRGSRCGHVTQGPSCATDLSHPCHFPLRIRGDPCVAEAQRAPWNWDPDTGWTELSDTRLGPRSQNQQQALALDPSAVSWRLLREATCAIESHQWCSEYSFAYRDAVCRKENPGLYPRPSSHRISYSIAGWSSQAARRAHNPKVGGSNPPPATRF